MVEAISEPKPGNGILVYKCRLCGEHIEDQLSSNVRNDLAMFLHIGAEPVIRPPASMVHKCHGKRHGICDLVGGHEYGQD